MDENLESVKPVFSLILPSDIIMFKMMRACIAVNSTTDLWIYNSKNLFR